MCFKTIYWRSRFRFKFGPSSRTEECRSDLRIISQIIQSLVFVFTLKKKKKICLYSSLTVVRGVESQILITGFSIEKLYPLMLRITLLTSWIPNLLFNNDYGIAKERFYIFSSWKSILFPRKTNNFRHHRSNPCGVCLCCFVKFSFVI